MDLLSRIDTWGRSFPERAVHRSGGTTLSWGDLIEQSDALAGAIARGGIASGSPIVVRGHKESEMLIGFLGCAKAGHAYVPVDVGAPEARVERIIAAADCYQAMISDRPYRRALATGEAAIQLRIMSTEGHLDGEAVERVLAAAGHRRLTRVPLPAGLTTREVDVLRLMTLGLTTRQIAQRLFIAPKTADHHVQHIYTKIGVSTRGAASLYAIEHGILPNDPDR